jgi:flagellar hook-associated protein 1
MSSTFSGLEIAKRALFTQQSALYTTSHNIANANTPGYSRQRVNFVQTDPYPAPARNRPEIPGQIGQGVEAGSVQRVRDRFVDMQFRTEHNKLGYWESRANSLSQMEQILNEPSDTGLSAVLNQFWQALNDLSVNPEDAGARAVVQQRGVAVAETFNYLSDSLTAIQKDIASEIDVTTKDINSLLRQIQGINDQIKAVEPHGYLPNDLYDERDRLIDELSNLVNIKVDYESSGGKSLAIAEGIVNITLLDANGNPLKDSSGNDFQLITPDNKVVNEIHVIIEQNANGQSIVTGVNIGGTKQADGTITGGETIDPPTLFTSVGKLKGLIESHGFKNDNNEADGLYTNMLADIDKMAYAFAYQFNEVHKAGYNLNNDTGVEFFELGSFTATNYIGYAGNIDLTEDMKKDTDLIAASTSSSNLGNGENAINLANVKDDIIPLLGSNTSIESFYESIIGNMAVQAQEANRMAANAQTLGESVEARRQSISGVSLDEEMTNLIKFQHAYNAAARSMTAVDEMLDRIINQMGLVGR